MFLVDDIIFVNDVDLESEQLHRLVRPFASGPLWSPSLGSACCERGACTAITAVTARDRQLATSSEHQLLLCHVRFRRIDSASGRCLSHPSGAAKPQGQSGLLIGSLRLGTTGSPRSVCSASAVCSLTAVCTPRHVLALYALLRLTGDTTRRYSPLTPPPFSAGLEWAHADGLVEHDWAYPMSLDGNIFRADEIRQMILHSARMHTLQHAMHNTQYNHSVQRAIYH